MAQGEASTPRPSSAKKAPPSSSNGNQKTLLGFFSKAAGPAPSAPSMPSKELSISQLPERPSPKKKSQASQQPGPDLTPAPSSDAPDIPSPSHDRRDAGAMGVRNKSNGLLSPITPANTSTPADSGAKEVNATASLVGPRKVYTIHGRSTCGILNAHEPHTGQEGDQLRRV